VKYKTLIYKKSKIYLPSKIKSMLNSSDFKWILNAEFENAVIEITENNKFIWRMGTWYKGHWHGDAWADGIWYNGYWHNGEWFDGIWHNGTWINGIWHNGIWKKGVWKNGEKKNTYSIRF